jgi:hypothetical protein
MATGTFQTNQQSMSQDTPVAAQQEMLAQAQLHLQMGGRLSRDSNALAVAVRRIALADTYWVHGFNKQVREQRQCCASRTRHQPCRSGVYTDKIAGHVEPCVQAF